MYQMWLLLTILTNLNEYYLIYVIISMLGEPITSYNDSKRFICSHNTHLFFTVSDIHYQGKPYSEFLYLNNFSSYNSEPYKDSSQLITIMLC